MIGLAWNKIRKDKNKKKNSTIYPVDDEGEQNKRKNSHKNVTIKRVRYKMMSEKVKENDYFFKYCPFPARKAGITIAVGFILTSATIIGLSTWKLITAEECDVKVGENALYPFCPQMSFCFPGEYRGKIVLAISIIVLIVNVDLLMGIVFDKRRFFISWLIVFTCFFCITFCLFIYFVILIAVSSQNCALSVYAMYSITTSGFLLYLFAIVVDLFHRLHPDFVSGKKSIEDDETQRRYQTYVI